MHLAFKVLNYISMAVRSQLKAYSLYMKVDIRMVDAKPDRKADHGRS